MQDKVIIHIFLKKTKNNNITRETSKHYCGVNPDSILDIDEL